MTVDVTTAKTLYITRSNEILDATEALSKQSSDESPNDFGKNH
ncbi:hypothetical protein [Vibrio vulnificus]|nr:hypothetical protein [Vibrio vulnificus]